MTEQTASDRGFIKRVFIVVGIVIVAVIFLFLLQYVGYVLLLAFAGILLAVGFDGLAMLVQKYTPLTRAWSMAVVLLALIALTGAIGGLLGSRIADQMAELAQRMPQSLDSIQARLQAHEWGRVLLQHVPEPRQLLMSGTKLVGQITGVFSTALGALTNAFVIVVVAIYIAIDPSLYSKSAINLLPPKQRDRAYDVFGAMGHALRRWFAGRLCAMALIGILTYIGLSLIDMPVPLALGFVAGILEFVPYLGPILTLIPILLVALLEGPVMVLYAFLVYCVIQLAESYLIEPMIEERAVSIPPAYVIIVQVLGGVLAGTMGVILSAPLAVTVAVTVQMLYMEDVLGESVQVMGSGRSSSAIGNRIMTWRGR
jgi:predicted PurR-regulated permease PerM